MATRQRSIETDERMELVFGMVASFHLSYTTLKGNSGISKNKGTSPGTLSKTPDSENFATAYRSRKVLSTQLEKGGRSERDKLERRQSSKLTMPSSSDARPL